MAQQAGEFTFRLSATGGDQLVRILRNAGDAGEQMAARIQRSAQATGGALTTVETGANRAAAALARVDREAGSGFGSGSRFESGLRNASVLVTQFSSQLTGVGGTFGAVATQATRFAGALSGGLAGLGVSLGIAAAQFLFSNRATTEAEAATSLYERALRQSNEVLETAAERSRRLADERRNEAIATAEAAAAKERDTIAQGRNAEARALGIQERLRQAVAEGRAPPSVLEGGAARAGATAQGVADLVGQARARLATVEAEIARLRAPPPPVTSEVASGRGGAGGGEVERVLARLRSEQDMITRSAERLAAANRTADEVYQDQITTINELLPRLVDLYGIERANEIAARASVGALEERNRALERGSERAAGAARDLGFAFSSAFEDAILKGKSLGDVVRGLSNDIARVILRRSITDPLANAFTGALSGFSFSSLFPTSTTTAPIVPVTSEPLRPFASGGVFDRALPFGFDGGRRLGVLGEAGPEAIMPLERGSDGRLGVRAQGDAGGGMVINTTLNIDARGADPASEARLRALAPQIVQRSVAATLDAIRRGGSARAIARGV